jgi:hypothetical protein
VVSLGIRDWRSDSLSAILSKMSLAAVVYYIRLQRHAIHHGSTPRSENQILNAVNWDIKHRVFCKGRFKKV